MLWGKPRGRFEPLVPTMLILLAVALAGLLIGAFLVGDLTKSSSRFVDFPQSHPQAVDVMIRGQQALRDGDYKEAVALFTRLADHNDPLAEYWLGHMTELGLGVSRDPQKAIELYRKAAAQDVVPAELSLGELFLYGDVVPPDFAQAADYLKQAAKEGNARAATLLGQIYGEGLGMTADPGKAYAWSEVATLEGSSFARNHRDAYLRSLSPDQQKAAIARARQILAEIKQANPKHQANEASAGRSQTLFAPSLRYG